MRKRELRRLLDEERQRRRYLEESLWPLMGWLSITTWPTPCRPLHRHASELRTNYLKYRELWP